MKTRNRLNSETASQSSSSAKRRAIVGKPQIASSASGSTSGIIACSIDRD
jgi:hypothetical protein